MKMKKTAVFLIVCALAILMSDGAAASGWDDARSIAMAGSYTAIARGYDAVGFNPANLALSDRPGTTVQFFGIGSMINNNAFSVGDYKRFNGAYLTKSDKREILDKIPDSGLEFKGNSGASLLSFSYRSFAVSTTAEASGTGNISKDVVDLAFFGNKIGETIDVSEADAEGVIHADINFAYARQVKSFQWGDVTAGLNFKYIRGFASFEVTEASANATTYEDGIDGDGRVVVRTATGGSGFGLDLGTAAKYSNDWTFSLGIKNLISRINWTEETEENEYTYNLISLTAENADDDSTVVSDEIERSIGSFSTSLAPQLNLGASYEKGDFLFASDVKFGLAKRAGVTTTPELSFGTEYTGMGFLPLRGGFAFGGLHGASLGLGSGLKFSSFFIDFAWASSGTLLPTLGRGGALAISSGLKF